MRKLTIAFAALIAASPAIAGDMTPANSVYVYGATTADAPFISPAEQARRNSVHARQTYDLIIANGGCNSDFNTVEYVTYCHAETFGAPQMGSKD